MELRRESALLRFFRRASFLSSALSAFIFPSFIVALSVALSSCNPAGDSSVIESSFLGGIALSYSQSSLSASSTSMLSGATLQVTLTTRDQNGTIYKSTEPLNISFSVSGGTSRGTFSSVTDNHDGTYTATLTGTVAGTLSYISATINGTPLSSASLPLTVVSGNYSLAQSVVTVSSPTVTSGSTVTATLQVNDSSGNPLTSGGLAVSFSRSGGTSTGTFSAVTDNGDGTYTATFTGITAGTSTTISASIIGSPITSTLPTVTVNPGAPAHIAVSSGNSQSTTVASALPSSLVVLVTDANSNPVSGITVDWTVTGSASLGSASSVTNSSGLASDTLTLGTTTGTYSVTAKIHGTSTSSTFTETATPGIIDNFLLSSVPATATAGTAFNFTVTARDSYNNVKTDYTGVVHFSSSDPNSPTLPSNYTFLSSDAGVKQFSFNLKTTGNQTITVNQVAGGTPTATTSNIAVSPGSATQLAIITGPTTTVAGASITTMLVRALDAQANTATSFNGNITFSIGTNAGSGTLSGTTTVAAVNGSASFPGLSINKTGTGYTLVASATGLTSFTSSTFNITPGAPSSISVVSGNNQSGTVATSLGSALVVVVKDANNNTVPGTTVDWTSSDGNLSSASVSTDSAGQASNSLTLGHTAGASSVTATVNGTAISTSFTETATAASTIGSIAWLSAPATPYTASNSSAMTTFSAKLLDIYGNTITSNSSTTVTLSLLQGTGTLGGTLTRTASNGIATFSNITYTRAESIKITATENTSSKNVVSSSITVDPSTPSSALSFITAAASSVSADGATPVNVTISLKDAYGNTVPNTTVTFASTGTGNTLTQPASQTDSNGEAVGSMVSSVQGVKTLSIASPASLTNTTTVTFVSTSAVPANSTITGTGPVIANGVATSTITITLKDTLNNAVTGVTPSFSATGTSNTYGTCSATDGSGVSTCTLSSTKAETKTLSITGPISKSDGSVTFTAGSASQIVWTTNPSGGTAGVAWATQGIAKVEDAFGNIITSGADATATVTLSIQSGTGSLLGTTSMSAVAGVADFSGSGLKINSAGTKVIRATKSDTSASGGTSSVTADSSSITISASTATTLSVSGFSSPSTAGSSHSLTVTALDTYGNTATSYTGTIHFTSNDSQATLPSDYTFVAGDSGSKTISGTVLKTQSVTASITATDTVTGSITGSQTGITVTSATADHLAKTAGDSQSATVGTSVATAPKVQVLDAYGNAVSGVVLTFTPSAGSVGSSTVTSDASGYAQTSFTLGTSSGSNTLTVARQTTALPGSPATVTFTETGTPATAATLSVTGFPSSVIAGSSNSLTVTALDTYGNVATGYTGTVHFTSIDSQAVLPSDYTFTTGSGQDNGTHSFSGVKLKTAGTQSITATDTVSSSITGTQSSLTVGASTADHLVKTAGDAQSAVVGTAVATAPKVQVLDAYGNAVSGTVISFTVASGGGSTGSATGTSDASGYASTTFTLGTSVGSNTLTAARQGTALPGAPATITFTETATVGAATQLAFTTQPTGGVAEGVTLPTQPVIEIRDTYGNVVTSGADATANITLSLSSGTGTLSGTTTVAAASGVATFSGIAIDTQGTGKVITATKANTSGSGGTASLSQTSNSFTINPPAPGAFSITSVTPGVSSVVLTWGASTNASSYTVKYGTSSGTYGTTVSTNATSPLTISSLTAGTTYYFKVTAVNVTGSTNSSNELSSAVYQSFTLNVPYTALTDSSYVISDTSLLELTGGVCRLKPSDQTDDDNSASGGFGGATLSGTQWDSTNSYVRLNASTNNAELDSSWAPQWSSLVGYWKLNESAGTTSLTDSSSTGNTATANAGVTMGGSGKLNTSAYFNGTTGQMTVPTGTIANAIKNKTAMTVAGWVKYSTLLGASSGANRVASFIFAGGVGTTSSFFNITIRSDAGNVGVLQISGRSVPGDTGGTLTTQVLSQGIWYHFAAVLDYTNKKITGYINGYPFTAAATFSANTFSFTASPVPDRFGSDGNDANYFNGYLDDVAVWSTALTSAEITAIYNRQAPKYSGTLTSRVMDAYSSQSWTSLGLTSTLPFLKELTGSSGSETSSNYSSVAGNLMSSILGLWHLNETTGTTLTDSSGNGKDASIVNSPTLGVNGVFGNGVGLARASTQYVSLPSIDLTNTFTLSIWAKPNPTSTQWQTLFSNKACGANSGVALAINSWNTTDGTVRIESGNGTSGITLSSSSGVSTVGSWQHYLITVNRATGAANIYVNGSLVKTGTILTDFNTSGVIYVGNMVGCTAYFDGQVDEVAIWSRVLSAAEVLEVYRRGGNHLKYQVRSCANSDCSDQDALTSSGKGWKGPDNTYKTYFSELYNTTSNALAGTVSTGTPTMTFSNFSGSGLSVSSNRYFQYRTILESDDQNSLCDYGSGATSCSPELKSVTAGPAHYTTTAQTIISKASIGSAYQTLDTNGFTETLGSNSCSSGAKYALSSDGTTFYYWNGSAWATSSDYTTANNASTVRSNISTFPSSAAGTGTLQIKTFLKSTGTSACEVDNLQITGAKF